MTKFSNSMMRVPQRSKLRRVPHMAFIGGFWRVSPLPETAPNLLELWNAAYEEVDRRNQAHGIDILTAYELRALEGEP